ncbi:MAG: UTP--glucose-1-phosphate uridylyltransferase [Bacillota bacterium]
MKVRKAVIPAAGLGTRFLPATKAMAKEMLPLIDVPVIQLVVEEAVKAGIEDILIITGRGKRPIEDHFDKAYELEDVLRRKGHRKLAEQVESIAAMADIHFIRQKEPLGLGHAVLRARQHVGDEPFALLLGDEVFAGRAGEPQCLGELVRRFEAIGHSVLGIQEVAEAEVGRYGIVDIEQAPALQEGALREVAASGALQGSAAASAGRGLFPGEPTVFRVRDLVEKPDRAKAPSRMAIVGRYVLEPAIFDYLERTKPGAGGEIQLTDALKAMKGDRPIYASRFSSRRFDVGDKPGYVATLVHFALARPELAGALVGGLLSELDKLPAADRERLRRALN